MPRRYLVISDVDGTLCGDAGATERFARWWARQADAGSLVYSSGRFCDSVLETVYRQGLPAPAAIIGGVGTEIRMFDGGAAIDAWTQIMDDGFSAPAARQAVEAFGIAERQPDEFQSPWKVSYFWSNATEEKLAALAAWLHTRGVRAQLVYSSQRDLDLIPVGANKGNAARFLASMWGYPATRVVVAGDSHNDLAMFHCGFRGITVANAAPGLRALTGPNLYHAQKPFADGVREGLQHWLAPSVLPT